MINKINRRLGVLQRIKDCLDLDTRCVLYTSLILPLFDYADTIWGDENNTVLMDSQQTLENKAVKLILDEHPRYLATIALQRLKRLSGGRKFSGNFKCKYRQLPRMLKFELQI